MPKPSRAPTVAKQCAPSSEAPPGPINLALLTVEGTEQALDSLQGALDLEIDIRWKKGEPTRQGGEPRWEAGLTATIADTANPHEMVAAIRRFLAMSREQGLQFDQPDLFARLGISVSVGDSAQFAASLQFT